MPKNLIVPTGPGEDQTVARLDPIHKYTTLAATDTEPAQETDLPALIHEDRQPEAPSDNALDQFLHSSLAHLTGGLSPAAIAEAYFVWATHLAFSPGKQQELLKKAVEKWQRLINQAQKLGLSDRAAPCITPLPQDRRFVGEAWQRWPFSLIYQGFLLNQQWWHNATMDVGGVSRQHEAEVEFATRQLLDMFSPSNFLATNPEILSKSIASGGANLLTGFGNFMEDARRKLAAEKPIGTESFKVGRDVAVTPGQVIYSNRLIELNSIRAHDRDSSAGADTDRPGMDHEILHP